jgi:hypothetical protein
MAYIGPAPNPGQNREVDDISSGFNGGTAAFTLQVNGQNVSPGSSNAIIVSLGGVIQNPGTDYTVAGSTITFTTNPASGLSFFGLVLGQSIDTEGTADGSIVNASVSGSAAIAGTKISPDFGSQNILTTGNSGVGTGTPESKLAVKGSSGAADLFSISDVAVPTSGGEYGVAMIKTNSTEFALNVTGYNTASKGVKIYNNGGATARTSFEIAHAAGTKFIVDGTGNVGIGTSSASSTLTVSGNIETSGDVTLTVDDEKIQLGASQDFLLFHNTDKNFIYGVGNHPITFTTNNAEKMRLTADGVLKVGTSDPTIAGEILHVKKGGASDNVASFFFNNVQDRTNVIIKHDRAVGGTAATMIDFIDQLNGSSGKIRSDGSSTSYDTSSDYRLKENAVPISDGITRLKTLKPYRFNFKVSPTKTVDGFFAHEVTAVPEAISGEKDGMEPLTYYEEGDTLPSGKQVGDAKTFSETKIKAQTIDHSKLVPLLVAAVKELITKVETLEAA